MSEDVLKKRREELLKKFKKKNILLYVILTFIVLFGYYTRTRNLWLLKDVTTGKYIPLALDPYVFLRYAKYIVEHGTLFTVDYMKNYPVGFPTIAEVPLLPYFIAYLYKILHFFNSAITIEQAHILYPPICFTIGLIFFFLLLKRLLNYKVALVSTAFLTVVPPFLYRTMAGFSDKEALATMFIFMTFYFFVRGWQEKSMKKTIIFSVLAGITTGSTALSWGGVSFAYMIIGVFGILSILLNKFSKKDFYHYTSWFLVLMVILFQFGRGGGGITIIRGFITSSTSSLVALAFFMGIISFFVFKLDLLKIKDKIKNKLPLGFATFLISIILVVVLVTIFIDPLFVVHKPVQVIDDLLNPLANRWVLTVAESHEPYITDWFAQMSFRYIILVIAGSALLVYEMVRSLKKKYSLALVSGYTILLLFFIFSRYSRSSPIFNGTTSIAKFAFIGSAVGLIIGIIVFYLYTFYKDREAFNALLKIRKEYIFVLVWFIIMIMGARRAVRLIFIFAPVTTVFFGYFSIKLFDYARELLKKDWYKIIAYILIGILIISTFSGFAKTTLAQAKYTGPSYNQQWQNAGEWIRNNTPEGENETVFAHWWDYGYWVQTGGERATITDGGNAQGYYNYLMGRHVLTGQSDEETLPFLKAHDATHLLIISDEIGKYPAFSSIGSDAAYDRYSWINTFILDEQNIQELRDKVVYLYRGGTPLDDDFTYQDILYPKQAAGVAGFFISINQESDKPSFEQPFAVLVYNGQQVQVPLNCIFINGEEIIFGSEGLDGCLRIIPKIDGQKMNPIGAALYLSPKVRKSRVAQLYLFSKDSDYFKTVYTDEAQMPLSFYNGRIIGPLKIWEISYPANLEVSEEIKGKDFPDLTVTYI
ncbi:MAG: glycosyltransferase family 39 protein [Nanoarchaeota archaeon]|nr:glycosyltransferase family 39 protein [Nanoarchaeota archaeon]